MREFHEEIIDFLVNSLNTSQLTNLASHFAPRFDIRQETGFEGGIPIPLRVGVETLINFLGSDEEILDFVCYIFSREGLGAGSGGIISIHGRNRLLQAAGSNGWAYYETNNRFIRDQSRSRTRDWGILRENETYIFTFASIDIVQSSHLVQKNELANIEETLNNFKHFVTSLVEEWNGRVWNWKGDGGLTAFYGQDNSNTCVTSMASIISYLPHFNVTFNTLNPESDIKVRIGAHYGPCTYHKDQHLLANEDIDQTIRIQEEFTDCNSLSISREVFNNLRNDIGPLFHPKKNTDELQLYSYDLI